MIKDEFEDYVGHDVVVDTSTPLLFIGRLEEVGEHVLRFGQVDVHDMSDGQNNTTKEIYVIESKKYGVRANRAGARVRVATVVSVSRLDEVIEF